MYRVNGGRSLLQGNRTINQDSVCYSFENANESRNVAESVLLQSATLPPCKDSHDHLGGILELGGERP